MKYSVSFIILIFLLAIPMKPQTPTPQDRTAGTGIELVKTCGISPPPDMEGRIRQGYCFGLVHGMFEVLAGTGHIHFTTFVSNGQMTLVVKKYLNDHPERLGEGDTVLVRDALIAAFPPTEENRKRLFSPACIPV